MGSGFDVSAVAYGNSLSGTQVACGEQCSWWVSFVDNSYSPLLTVYSISSVAHLLCDQYLHHGSLRINYLSSSIHQRNQPLTARVQQAASPNGRGTLVSPVTLIRLRVNMADVQQSTYYINAHTRRWHSSIRRNRPGCSRQQVPTAEVRSVFLYHLLNCELTWSMCSSLLTASIHILNDDSLQCERIDQGAIGGESQRQRYTPFSCNTYYFVS